MLRVCVCVEHLHRCKTSTAGGHRSPIELCPTKLSMVPLRYPDWSPGRTCLCHSNRLSWEPACRMCWFPLHCCRNLVFNLCILFQLLVRTELQIRCMRLSIDLSFYMVSACCLGHVIGLCLDCWILGRIVMVGILIFIIHRWDLHISSRRTR